VCREQKIIWNTWEKLKIKFENKIMPSPPKPPLLQERRSTAMQNLFLLKENGAKEISNKIPISLHEFLQKKS
jgi:hypothetical protein